MLSEKNSVRVLVCANSAQEVAELQAIIRESDALQLVASSLGHDPLDRVIQSARPEVILDQSGVDPPDGAFTTDPPGSSVVRILLVSDSQLADAMEALRSDASSVRGVLPMWSSDGEICAAVEAVAEGLIVLHPDLVNHHLPPTSIAPDSDPAIQALSPRETEILNLLAGGLGNKQIASQLKISEHTVKFHVTSIFNKLNASSRAEAVAIGARRGLILF
jgi:NarL family two-component system response regulator YdfI